MIMVGCGRTRGLEMSLVRMIDGSSGFFSSAHRLVVTDDGFHGAESAPCRKEGESRLLRLAGLSHAICSMLQQ